MTFFEHLKTLFSGKLFSENIFKINSGVVNNGNINVTLHADEEDDKKISLSQDEQEILYALAEGADIVAARDEKGCFIDAVAFGNTKANLLSREIVLSNLGRMLRKGLLDRYDDTHFRISEVGRRIVVNLDLKLRECEKG